MSPAGHFLPAGPWGSSWSAQETILLAASWLDEAGRCRLREEEGPAQAPRARWWFSDRAVLELGVEGRAVVRELRAGLSAAELQASCPVPLLAAPSLRPMAAASP